MYCPLCKAEYRAGSDHCSDCLVGLVQTFEQAKAVNVLLLWNGTRQSRFNDLAGALRDANIPHYAKSGAEPDTKRNPWAHVGFYFRLSRAYNNLSWQIFVLESDYSSAKEVMENHI